jgi:hypothetical protein
LLSPPEPLRLALEWDEASDLPALFLVRGLASPDLLNRVVGLLAQQARIPSMVMSRRVGESLAIRIALDEIDGWRALILAEKMRALVMVQSVRLSRSSARLARVSKLPSLRADRSGVVPESVGPQG